MNDLTVTSHGAITEVGKNTWAPLTTTAIPFLEYDFLAGLEITGCVGGTTGWHPQILTVAGPSGEVVGGCAAYVKTHSMGEFVYDWTFADAAHRNGIAYYPKLIVAIQTSLLNHLVSLAEALKCQSLHLLFCTPEEAALAAQKGFFTRLASQLHWENQGFESFDDFLGRFRARKRKEIRRERRLLSQDGVSVESLWGDEIPDELCAPFYSFYADTIGKFAWGRRYLCPEFFSHLWDTMRHRLQVNVARVGNEAIGGSLNLFKDERCHGRYWGCTTERAHLHFECCTYAPVETCIERGINTFEAGAGEHAHKFSRGFVPTETLSSHLYFHDDFHRSVEAYCAKEAAVIRQHVEDHRSGPFIR
jgi:predicted N-acyltransferase